jgi:hypothetical protein
LQNFGEEALKLTLSTHHGYMQGEHLEGVEKMRESH